MENVFAGRTVYGGNWQVVDSRDFNSEEKAAVLRAEVVPSQYGLSVVFFMRGGGQTYIPLSNTSSLTAGDPVDMGKAKLLTLHRDGQGDINRVEI